MIKGRRRVFMQRDLGRALRLYSFTPTERCAYLSLYLAAEDMDGAHPGALVGMSNADLAAEAGVPALVVQGMLKKAVAPRVRFMDQGGPGGSWRFVDYAEDQIAGSETKEDRRDRKAAERERDRAEREKASNTNEHVTPMSRPVTDASRVGHGMSRPPTPGSTPGSIPPSVSSASPSRV